MSAIRDPTTGRSWATVSDLIDHLVSVCHGYLRRTVSVADQAIERIACEHVAPVTLMDRLQRQFTALADLLETHMVKQECWVFPKIRHLRQPVGEICWSRQVDEGLAEQIERLTRDNQEALSMLQQIVACLTDRRWSVAGPLGDKLVENIRELQENFAKHAQLETEVLFPHVRELLQPRELIV